MKNLNNYNFVLVVIKVNARIGATREKVGAIQLKHALLK